MEETEERLRRFDQLTIDRGKTEIGISRDLAVAWAKPFPMESDNAFLFANPFANMDFCKQSCKHLFF